MLVVWPGFFLNLPGQVAPLGVFLRWLGPLLEGALLWAFWPPPLSRPLVTWWLAPLCGAPIGCGSLPPTRVVCFYKLRVRLVSVPRVGAWGGWPDLTCRYCLGLLLGLFIGRYLGLFFPP